MQVSWLYWGDGLEDHIMVTEKALLGYVRIEETSSRVPVAMTDVVSNEVQKTCRRGTSHAAVDSVIEGPAALKLVGLG